jgi:hypothetical protein
MEGRRLAVPRLGNGRPWHLFAEWEAVVDNREVGSTAVSIAMTKESQRWIVARIKGSKSEEIAIVAAKDAAGAIATVVKDRGITDADYIKRLVARPMG